MKTTNKMPWRIILLILAGESIFLLPFVLARVFRPTFLAVFELTNIELGSCFSLYGIVALVSYLFGGGIADRFEARKLMSVALCLTAFGGFYMATFPSIDNLQALYAYWGFTTIFLFWSAMIKATRAWGGSMHQGRAFGFLEGGRGFVAASLGVIGVWIFASFLPASDIGTEILERKEAFQWVIISGASFCLMMGGLVYFFLGNTQKDISNPRASSLGNIRMALKIPAVRYLMVIVLSAYIGYKVTDVFSLFAAEVMHYSELDAAKIGSYQMYLRPFVCLLMGVLADRFQNSRVLVWAFLMMFVGALFFASGWVNNTNNGLFIFTLLLTATGTYALRAVYFAAMQEGQIPFEVTGTAVGLISVVGYTPDIFVGPVMGFFLDGYEGIWGHQQLFIFLAFFGLVGAVTAYRFRKKAVDSII